MINKTIIFLKKQKVFIFLILILFILIILKLSLKKIEKEEKPIQPLPLEREKEVILPDKEPEFKKEGVSLSPSPAERLTETEGTEEDTRQTLKLYPLIEYLPINNEKYHLTYTNPFELTVTIKQGKEEDIRKEIVDWIVSRNIDSITHQIIFK